MSEDKKKNLTSALDKMEAESAVRAQEGRKIRIQDKHHRKEIESEKKIKAEQETEETEIKKFEFRSTTTQIGLGLITSFIMAWNLSTDQRTSLIEIGIIIILCCGMIAAKKNR